MTEWGIATIAVGEKALLENKKCLESVSKYLPDIPAKTINYVDMRNIEHLLGTSDMQLSRLIKTDLINLIPPKWDYCIYLDSDTRLMSADLVNIIAILEDGYDLAICPSTSQDYWHIDEKEKTETFNELEYQPLQLQGGVFGFAVNDKMREFFLYLSNEYMLYSSQDQCALVRAMHKCPIKYWLFGNSFNSSNGSVVRHLFGNTR